MAPSKYSEAEVLEILRQAREGVPVAEVCQTNGISIATFYRWQKTFGHLLPVRRLDPPCGQG